MKKGKRNQKVDAKATLVPTLPLVAPVILRIKAFIVDIFMIYVPILYITAYLILDGKNAFQSNQWAILVDGLLFASIIIAFWVANGQSPGYRAYQIQVIDIRTQKSPSLVKAIVRYLCFLLAGTSLIGIFIAPFRKDKKNLHDILSGTLPVLKPS